MVLAGVFALQPGPVAADAWEGLAEAAHSDLVTTGFRDSLARFYAERRDRPLWFASVRPSARAVELLAVLADAASEGLDPADYQPDALRQACVQNPPPDPVDCELRLSDSLLRYARDVGYGALSAAEVDPAWYIPQQTLPAAKLLTAVADSDALTSLLRGLPPSHDAYRRLRRALADYRQAAHDAWPVVPPGPSLRPGDRDDRVPMLRARLRSELPAPSDAADADLYDPPLRAAVEAFQARHGLVVDGIVGRQTLAALNVPLAERIAELRLNMERWRWVPRELGAKHILVNLASFELTLAQTGHRPLRMRVIGGRPDRSTPAIQSAISRLVLNPVWTVPRRVAVEDLLPQLQQDPLALQAKDISVLARADTTWVEVDPAGIDWHGHHANDFPFVLRQAAGPRNSLGRIKFDMANAFDIYLHDTPAKGLFGRPLRAFSAGCIRVQQPLRLAARLLDSDPDRAAAALWRRIDRGDTQYIPVASEVPVYLVYLTAWVDDAGEVQFRRDLYRRNGRLRHTFAFETGE
jgi:murein L,D-transpeptidase YcbB/YkuD